MVSLQNDNRCCLSDILETQLFRLYSALGTRVSVVRALSRGHSKEEHFRQSFETR